MRLGPLLSIPLARFHNGIDPAFKLPVEAQTAAVRKRQHLRHKNSRDALAGIDPVIRIEEATPGQAVGTATAGNGLRVDHMTEAPFEMDAGT